MIMPLKNVKYRVKTTKSGQKIRLAWRHGRVVEVKKLAKGHRAHKVG